jgi:hypothetical protein
MFHDMPHDMLRDTGGDIGHDIVCYRFASLATTCSVVGCGEFGQVQWEEGGGVEVQAWSCVVYEAVGLEGSVARARLMPLGVLGLSWRTGSQKSRHRSFCLFRGRYFSIFGRFSRAWVDFQGLGSIFVIFRG